MDFLLYKLFSDNYEHKKKKLAKTVEPFSSNDLIQARTGSCREMINKGKLTFKKQFNDFFPYNFISKVGFLI